MLRVICVAVLAALSSVAATAQARAEPRIALVVGEAAYLRALPNTANDAGLVAETLKSAGFEVLGGADLNGVELHRAVRDFLDRVEASGPGTAAVVYFAGHGLQLEGENFLVPVDARIERASDIPYDSVKVSDIVRSLANARAAVRMIVLDAARDYPLRAGEPPARGLAAMEAPEGFLLAFSAAPDATAPDATGPYGPYAIALVEAIRRPGLEPDEVFARVRLRVHEGTAGRQTPWDAVNLNTPFVFFEPAASHVPVPAEAVALRRRAFSAMSPEEAYGIAVERNSVGVYQEFLRTYPRHPLANRVRVLLANLREALVWRQTVTRHTAEAYWTYLRTYPRGPHVAECRRRLLRLSAPPEPPRGFTVVDYDLPPPIEVETVDYVDVTVVERDLPPPPAAPAFLLPPPPREIVELPPPAPSAAPHVLPVPVAIPAPPAAKAPAPGAIRPTMAVPSARPAPQRNGNEIRPAQAPAPEPSAPGTPSTAQSPGTSPQAPAQGTPPATPPAAARPGAPATAPAQRTPATPPAAARPTAPATTATPPAARAPAAPPVSARPNTPATPPAAARPSAPAARAAAPPAQHAPVAPPTAARPAAPATTAKPPAGPAPAATPPAAAVRPSAPVKTAAPPAAGVPATPPAAARPSPPAAAAVPPVRPAPAAPSAAVAHPTPPAVTHPAAPTVPAAAPAAAARPPAAPGNRPGAAPAAGSAQAAARSGPAQKKPGECVAANGQACPPR